LFGGTARIKFEKASTFPIHKLPLRNLTLELSLKIASSVLHWSEKEVACNVYLNGGEIKNFIPGTSYRRIN
jgi:hypothetical protein